jgi:hypothetical protein
MKAKVIATALGAVLLSGSTLALADEWRMRETDRPGRYLRDRDWSDHDRRDWGRDHKKYRGHGHHAYGHSKPYWHHKYQHHHHHDHYSYWSPYGYERDGVTIIFRGSF